MYEWKYKGVDRLMNGRMNKKDKNTLMNGRMYG
jgi:hypothetical protein